MIFRPELAEAILRFEKTATRRRLSDNPRSPWYREKCGYKVGQVFTINPGRGVANVGRAKVRKVYKQALGDMTVLDAEKEGFRDREGHGARYWFVVAWREINKHCMVLEQVWVIEFDLAREPAK